MANPLTQQELEDRLDTLDTLIMETLSSPDQYFELNGGSTRLSKPDYVRQLREERDTIFERLKNIPTLIETDVEDCI